MLMVRRGPFGAARRFRALHGGLLAGSAALALSGAAPLAGVGRPEKTTIRTEGGAVARPGPGASAVSRDDTLRLSLSAFVDSVVHLSPALRSSRLEVGAADAGVSQAGAPPNPRLSFEGPDAEDAVTLGVLQPFRWPGQGSAAEERARGRVALADARRYGRAARLRADAARAYLEAVVARRRLALRDAALRLADLRLDRRRAAYRQGLGSRSDTLDARLARERAAAQLSGAGAGLRLALGRVRSLLDLPDGASLLLTDGLPMDGPAGAAPGTALPAGDSATAGEAVPEVRSARAAVTAAEGELAWARVRTRPEPAIGPVLSRRPGNVSPGIGLELTVPLWDGNGAGRRSAESSLEAARLELEARRREADRRLAALRASGDSLETSLGRLRERELAPLRGEIARLDAARTHEMPVAEPLLAARIRQVALRERELELQAAIGENRVERAALTGKGIGE